MQPPIATSHPRWDHKIQYSILQYNMATGNNNNVHKPKL